MNEKIWNYENMKLQIMKLWNYKILNSWNNAIDKQSLTDDKLYSFDLPIWNDEWWWMINDILLTNHFHIG